MDWTEAHLQGDLEAMQQAREEAIVRAALERAAEGCKYLDAETPYWPGQFQNFIRSIASDPAEVAAIIKRAGERHD
jgi:hypothetical protein